jgi:hypothetical protein
MPMAKIFSQLPPPPGLSHRLRRSQGTGRLGIRCKSARRDGGHETVVK